LSSDAGVVINQPHSTHSATVVTIEIRLFSTFPFSGSEYLPGALTPTALLSFSEKL